MSETRQKKTNSVRLLQYCLQIFTYSQLTFLICVIILLFCALNDIGLSTDTEGVAIVVVIPHTQEEIQRVCAEH